MKRVIHLHLRYIKRSSGESVVGFAAYCSGERLRSQYDGCTHYKSRSDVVFEKIFLPMNAPEVYRDRETLWNSVEMFEGRTGQLARAIDLDLPIELNREDQIHLICDYVQQTFVDKGMCADVVIHDRENGNPHAHVILTLRAIDEDGHWARKWKKNYLLDEEGKRIYDPKTKRYRCGPSIPLHDWSDSKNAEKWRCGWADACNRALAHRGLETRVTHESYKRQGLDRLPQIHLGRKVTALERRNIHTDRGRKNREIIERNRCMEEKDRKREQERYRNPSRSR